jgi:hypothetical protein
VKATLSRDRASAHWDRSSVVAGGPDRGRGANPMARARRTFRRGSATAATRLRRSTSPRRRPRRGAQGGSRVRGGQRRGSSASRLKLSRDARGLAAAGHPLGRRREPALRVRRHVRSRAQRVRARRCSHFREALATARPHPGRGAGCAAAVAVPRWRRLNDRRRAAIAHGVVTVNLATYAQVRLDARLRVRDGAGIIEPAARRVRGPDGDRCAAGPARAGRGRRLRSMSGRYRCATAVPRGVRRSASCGRRAGG